MIFELEHVEYVLDIPLYSLSKTIQGTVQVVTEFGMGYSWTDAHRINQDDLKHQALEWKAIAQYQGSASLSITAKWCFKQ